MFLHSKPLGDIPIALKSHLNSAELVVPAKFRLMLVLDVVVVRKAELTLPAQHSVEALILLQGEHLEAKLVKGLQHILEELEVKHKSQRGTHEETVKLGSGSLTGSRGARKPVKDEGSSSVSPF